MKAKQKTPAALRPRAAALALAALGTAPAWGQSIETPAVRVVGTTPLPGLGRPAEEIPANVLSVDSRALREKQSLNLPDFMASQLPSVNVNEIQGNPYQPDLNYRGFSASPLLGTPQGLSVYVDGVRVNEPFGDTVNWDLIPMPAIAGMDLIPGSNPLFGLNTLGGALAVRTKSGDTHPGTRLETYGGSFGRRALAVEHGGKSGTLAWFVAGNWFKEDGWRDHSPSEVKQGFAKLSHRGERTELDLALTRAVTDLIGNGLTPDSMYRQRREQIFTRPDNTRNDLAQLSLSGRYWLTDDSQLAATVYHRQNRTRTLNGDVNDDFEGDPALDGEAGANGGLGFNQDTGANNRTRSRQTGSGAALQWSLTGERHQLALGASHDQSRSRFTQTGELGLLDASRGVAPTAAEVEENRLTGRTRTSSVFITDTYALAPTLHLTASARYNRTRVTTRDELDSTPPNLDGDFTYHKLNPAVGLTWQATPAVNFYAGYSQGNRAPSPIELGCADPANPCTLPNALASDPYLKQVVARTLELGARGRLGQDMQWNAGLFRTTNFDDILFIGTSTSAGYFTNFGQTRREGAELSLSGKQGRFDWRVNYSYVRATFRSGACLLAANNSSRGQAPECTGAGQDDEIYVQKGNRLPGLPEHSLKFSLAWRATDKVRLGADVVAFSSQYVRGNENNQHQAGRATDAFGNTRTFEGSGRLPGYAVLNLNGEMELGSGFELFGKINNVFDKRYATGGALAENPFDVGGAFQTNSDDWRRETFVAPGAPRAAWVGVRYRWN